MRKVKSGASFNAILIENYRWRMFCVANVYVMLDMIIVSMLVAISISWGLTHSGYINMFTNEILNEL